MPIYSYFCRTCGTFDKMRPMADSQKPSHCPQCGQSCDRQVTAVQLNVMSSAKRTAHRLNEKNAHEPRVRDKAGHAHGHAHHVHGPGCGHGHANQTLQPSASRPWQVGH